jgi:signal transduction protein with GAF and PtsI domain
MRKSVKELEEEIRRLSLEWDILNAIHDTVNQSVDLHEILNNSLDRIKALTEVSAVGLYLLDEQENDLVFAAHRGYSKTLVKGLRSLKLGEGVSMERRRETLPLLRSPGERLGDATRSLR